jgi:hypothetical protein
MLPAFDQHGLLPPFIGKGPSDLDGLYSPFAISITELVTRFGRTEVRKELLDGFLRYRAALRKAGLRQAVQWVDGSFVEQQESPGDVDVVTIFDMDEEEAFQIMDAHPVLFDGPTSRAMYKTDANFVSWRDRTALDQLTYYLGLFSHQRGEERRWKGLLRVSLGSEQEDGAARSLLEATPGRATEAPSIHAAGESR